MLTESRRNRRRRSGGQAVVEFALLLPLFLLVIVGGVVEFGISFYNYITLQQLANDAAQTIATNIPNGTTMTVYQYRSQCFQKLGSDARRLIGYKTLSMGSTAPNSNSALNMTVCNLVPPVNGVDVRLWQVDLEFHSPVWTPLFQFAMGLFVDSGSGDAMNKSNNVYFTLRTRAVFPTKIPSA